MDDKGQLVECVTWYVLLTAALCGGLLLHWTLGLFILIAWGGTLVLIKMLTKNQGLLASLIDVGNILDNPIDNLKHRLHGSCWFGYRLYLPKWLMRGSTAPEKGAFYRDKTC